jgi:hypothetical protein
MRIYLEGISRGEALALTPVLNKTFVRVAIGNTASGTLVACISLPLIGIEVIGNGEFRKAVDNLVGQKDELGDVPAILKSIACHHACLYFAENVDLFDAFCDTMVQKGRKAARTEILEGLKINEGEL